MLSSCARPFLATLALLFTCTEFTLLAAEPYEPRRTNPILENWRWREFPGMKNRALRTATEAPSGQMWFGYDQGVLAYDGRVWTDYGTGDGLSGEPINAILALPDGAIIAASDSGIDRFADGRWSRLFPKEPIPFPVNTLTLGAQGDFWAGTAWGALHFDGSSVELVATRQVRDVLATISPSTNVRVLPESIAVSMQWYNGFGLRTAEGEFLGSIRGRQAQVVLAVAPAGMAEREGIAPGDQVTSISSAPISFADRESSSGEDSLRFRVKPSGGPSFREVSIQRETLPGELRLFQVSQIMEDSDGDLWFALQSGEIFRLDGRDLAAVSDESAWTRFDNGDGMQIGQSPRLMQDRNGTVWYISNDRIGGGVNQFDGQRWTHFRLEDMGGSDNCTSIVQTEDGTILIGGFGLHALRDGTWSVYSASDLPIPFHRIRLVKTRAGMIWMIGLGEKATLYDPSTSRWDGFENIRFECSDGMGGLWFVEKTGDLIVAQGDNWQRFGEADGILPGVRNLYSDRKGEVWAVGTIEGQTWLARFDAQTFKWGPPRFSDMVMESPRPNAFFKDSAGGAWFGARNGALRIDDTGWKRFSPPQTPTQVYGIAESPPGRLWFGGDQLRAFDGETWSAVTDQEPFASWVECLLLDQEGGLWVGARSYGLYRLLDGQWTLYTEEQGLADNTVRYLGADSEGRILAMTLGGLSRFDGERWVGNFLPLRLDGSAKTIRFEATPDGDIWLNTDNFRPVRYRPGVLQPDTFILEHQKTVAQPGNCSFVWAGRSPWENSTQDELHYSWRLDDGPWSVYSPETRATLLDVRHGKHTFEVRARDRDFNVDPVPARVTFEVLPPVWLQTWFQTLVSLLVLMIGFQAYRIYQRDRKLVEAKSQLEIRVLERTRELAEEKERADAANRAKDEFLSVMSHEIRTPLNAIIGFTDLLLIDDTAAHREDFLQEIMKGGKQLVELFDEVMTFAALSTSNKDAEGEPSDIHALLESQVEALRPNAELKGLFLRIEAPDRHLPPLIASRDMLRLVFRCLLKNAVKFTEKGSIKVAFDFKKAEPGLWDVNIAFEDTGVGVPQSKLDAIFEPFIQTDSTNTRKYEGVGLGLSLVRRIMERLNGAVNCRSEVGVGSVFEIQLRLREPPPES